MIKATEHDLTPHQSDIHVCLFRQVCLLLKRGANQYAADEKGNDPLSIAIETAHADIVTL